ncbi:hypothetical protein ACJMK2_034520 [Sinanodonta woodiana]|uniref:Endonuclease/exonuclease/phosphatase domain-containing protein n=1 Tax=Sinanodonta woodiana TaxID=1069815 RepID=A0ABD3WVQ1_SINWO
MLVINFQSITNKGTELYNIIASSLPDIIIGTESHLDPNYNSAEILPHGIPPEHQYNTYRKDRKELINKNGGGVIILVRPNIKADECNDINTDYEIKWIKIQGNPKDQILVGAYYRPPDSDQKPTEELQKSLSKIKTNSNYKNAKIFLGGDFNLGNIDWD